jgi:Xaa-Pro aminopeptidase
MNPTSEKLFLVRDSMHKNNIDAYVIPSSDPHINENIADYWRIIHWLTGFSGSNATVVITGSFAGLWTDSRYFVQAEEQISGSGFRLFKPDVYQTNDYTDYLAENLRPESTLGFDGRIFSVNRLRKLKSRLAGLKINIDSDCDVISGIWSDRPPLPESVAFELPVKFSGKDRERKLAEVLDRMNDENIDFHLLTSPEDIMWLLNIRGRDHHYNPVVNSFALLGMNQTLLFVNENKIPVRIAHEFDKLRIVILPYDEITGIIPSIRRRSSILISPDTTSVSLYNSISARLLKKEGVSIPARLKSVKNKTEIENISEVMIKDGVALTRFFFWLEKESSLSEQTEVTLAEKLLEFRSGQVDFIGNSFASIVAFNEHSALPHYNPVEGKTVRIEEGGILLVDSGAHYLGGTTDITRTISTGEPSEHQKKDFTLVLKGHINLATSKFPLGTKGYQLDILARKALWEHGLNYGHGTGHGVGFCLNVHEGPQNISTAANLTIIEPGMLISNEPALYREGEYGIRTENLILCYEDEETDFGQFLRFETMSLCYIDKSLIELSILTPEEKKWLNNYHQNVYDKISPYITDAEKKWLKEKTEQI